MAKEFKGTPGVWCISGKREACCEINGATIDVWALGGIEQEEMEANAQLIVHAPEMRELLVSLADKKELTQEDRRWIFSLLDRIHTL